MDTVASNSAALNEINNLTNILLSSHSDEQVLNQIKHLSSFVREHTIFDEIVKLAKLVQTSNLGVEYKEQLRNIENYYVAKEKGYVPIQNKFSDLYLSQSIAKGTSFLCKPLDKRTGGIQNGTLTVIAGKTGSMKTTLAVNICYNAVKEGKNVAYLSLEETPQQLYAKLLSRVAYDQDKRFQVKDILQHKLEKTDETFLLNDVISFLNDQPGGFYIIGEEDLLNYEMNEIELKLNEIDDYIKKVSKEKNGEDNHGIDILVVDHIQMLKYANLSNDEFSVINQYVSFFRRQSLSFLHKKRQIEVILLSQVNREGDKYSKKNDGSYLVEHIAEASEIYRSATYIITTYTDPGLQISTTLKIGTLKLRNDLLFMDTINIFADGRYYCVGDVDVPEQPDYDISVIYGNDNKNENNESNANVLAEWGM